MKKFLFPIAVLFLFLNAQDIFPQIYKVVSPVYSDFENCNEPSIATNPNNENRIIVAVNHREVEYQNNNGVVSYPAKRTKIAIHYSSNLGASWGKVLLPNSNIDPQPDPVTHTYPPLVYPKYADPSVDYDNNGNAYCVFLGVDEKNNVETIFLTKSTDDGASWSTPVVIETGSGLDKPYLHIDKGPFSPLQHRIYVGYSRTAVSTGNLEIYFASYNYSTGQILKKKISNTPQIDCNGPLARTDQNGTVYLFYYQGAQSGAGKVMYTISYDGGNSFINPVEIMDYNNPLVTYPSGKYGNNNSSGIDDKRSYLGPISTQQGNSRLFRVNSMPSAAIDLSSNSIYVVWGHDRGEAPGGSGDGKANDIILAKSIDNGDTWSVSTIVSGEPIPGGGLTDAENFFPWISVNNQGNVSIVYYHMAERQSQSIIPVLLTSYNGQDVFHKTVFDEYQYKIELYASDYFRASAFLGDYLGITMTENYIMPVWTDIIDRDKSSTTDPKPVAVRIGLFKTKLPVKFAHNLPDPNTTVAIKLDNEENLYNVNNGSTIEVTPFTNHTFKVMDELKLGTSSSRKFMNWEYLSSLNYNTSHTDYFHYDFTDEPLNLIYKPVHQVSVKNYLEGVYSGTYDLMWKHYYSNGVIQVPYNNIPTQQSSYLFDNTTNNQNTYDITIKPSYTGPGNINMRFWQWDDWNMNLTRTEQFTGPRTLTAYYKGNLRTNNVNGISGSGQRKIVRSGNGYLHMVYESMNIVFYTRSTDGGTTWSEDEQLDEFSFKSQNPAIAFDNYNNIFFAYKKIDISNNATLGVSILEWNGSSYVWKNDIVSEISLNAGTDPNIAIAAHSGGALITYRSQTGSNGLNAVYVYYIPSMNRIDFSSPYCLPGTSLASSNPSIAYLNTTGSGPSYSNYGIVYQNEYTIRFAIPVEIRYVTVPCYIGTDNGVPNSAIINTSSVPANFIVSAGCGFDYNTSPSISAYNNNALVSWSGKRIDLGNSDSKIVEADEVETRKVVVRNKIGSTWQSGFFSAGTDVDYSSSALMQSGSDGAIIAWTENNGASAKYVKRKLMSYDAMLSLTPSGSMVQLSTGSNFQYMKGFVINTTSLPYSLNRITTDFSFNPPLSKISEAEQVSYARRGVVNAGGMEFVFSIGDVVLDENIIKFKKNLDTTGLLNIEEMLRTESFSLNSSSDLYFSDYYYSLYSHLADSILDRSVNFTVELINSETGAVVGQFDRKTFTCTNASDRSAQSYHVDCSGIPSGSYYLRLKVTGDGEIYVTDEQKSTEGLDKRSYRTLSFNGSELPTEYALDQNYPNPFNPSTTIRYQIPQAGRVSLKVYDILGREVASLVDEFKEQGRYEASFNAANLSSGTYVYKIQVNDYSSTRKMMLIK